MTTLISKLDTLPDTGGVFVVETEHSVYLIDVDNKTFERTNDLGNNPQRVDGLRVPYERITCDVGERMFIAADDLANSLRTTRVLAIFPDDVS